MKDRIYKEIRERIVDGIFAPGMRLVEAELAHQFGTSKTPVREALLHLDGEGLVDLTPHGGAQVTPLAEGEFEELLVIRYALELGVVDRVAERISNDELARAAALLDLMARAMDGADWRRYRTLERELHALVFGASGYPIVTELLLDMSDRMDRYSRSVVAPDAVLWSQDIELNRSRVDALQERQPAVLRKAITRWQQQLTTRSLAK